MYAIRSVNGVGSNNGTRMVSNDVCNQKRKKRSLGLVMFAVGTSRRPQVEYLERTGICGRMPLFTERARHVKGRETRTWSARNER